MKILFLEFFTGTDLQESPAQVMLLIFRQRLLGLLGLPLFLGFFTLPVTDLVQLAFVVDRISAGDMNREVTVRPRLINPLPFTW